MKYFLAAALALAGCASTSGTRPVHQAGGWNGESRVVDGRVVAIAPPCPCPPTR